MEDPDDVYARLEGFRTHLHVAVEAGDLQGVRALLDRGADDAFLLSALDAEGRTPLSIALDRSASDAYVSIARCLLERGASVRPSAPSAESPFSRAIATGGASLLDDAALRKRFDAARRTKIRGGGLEAEDLSAVDEFSAAACLAAFCANAPLLRRLLDAYVGPRGENFTACDVVVESSFMHERLVPPREPLAGPLFAAAAAGGSMEAVRLVAELSRGKLGRDGGALHAAAAAGRLGLVRWLVEERGEGPRADVRERGTPSDVAARCGREEVLWYLLDLPGMEPAASSALVEAAGRGHAALCRRLLERGGIDLAARHASGRPRHGLVERGGGALRGADGPRYWPPVSALEAAAEGGHVACLRVLLEAGADLAPVGPACMRLAAAAGRADVIRFLAARGVSATEAGGADAPAPLLAAARSWRPEAVRALAEVGAREAGGPSLLLAALGSAEEALGKGACWRAEGSPRMGGCIERMREETLRACLEAAGADPRARWERGAIACGTVLHAAMRKDVSAACVRILLDAGAEVDGEDGAGRTALALGAVQAAPSASLCLLVERGASVSRLEPEGLAGVPPGAAVYRSLLGAGLRAGLDRALERALAHRYTAEQAAEAAAGARLLLEAGASAAWPPALYHALTLSAEEPDFAEDVLRRALAAGVDLDWSSDATRAPGRPLSGALVGRHPRIVRAVLAAGASARAEPRHTPPLHLCVARGVHAHTRELVSILLAAGASFADLDEAEWSAVTCLLRRGNPDRAVLRFLIQEEYRCALAAGPEAPRPALRVGPEGLLRGQAAGYSEVCRTLDGEEGRAAMDLLLHCEGPLYARAFAAYRGSRELPARGGAAEATEPPARAALRVAQLEGRLAGDDWPDAGPSYYEAPPPEAGPEGETALACACRHGFRLAALRLARAAPDVDARDGEGETALSRAVAFGPTLLDVCEALIARGADVGAEVGSGAKRRPLLECTRDLIFRARLKRLAAVRDVFISYGHHPPEVAAFAASLRDRLQSEGISCWMDEQKPSGIEAGTEWREQIGAGIKAARAVVFVASKHSCASEWCALELSRARDLGRPILPVWREVVPLDDRRTTLLLGRPFTEMRTRARPLPRPRPPATRPAAPASSRPASPRSPRPCGGRSRGRRARPPPPTATRRRPGPTPSSPAARRMPPRGGRSPRRSPTGGTAAGSTTPRIRPRRPSGPLQTAPSSYPSSPPPPPAAATSPSAPSGRRRPGGPCTPSSAPTSTCRPRWSTAWPPSPCSPSCPRSPPPSFHSPTPS